MGSRGFLRGLEQFGTAQIIYDTARKERLEAKVSARYQDKARRLQALSVNPSGHSTDDLHTCLRQHCSKFFCHISPIFCAVPGTDNGIRDDG